MPTHALETVAIDGNDSHAMAGSGEDHSRQMLQLLQRLRGKNKLDMFKEPRESQCSWRLY